MARPLFITFSPYVWPYPPRPVFLGLLATALAAQIILTHKVPRFRRVLPCCGGLILFLSIPAGFLIPPQAGVLFGEFGTMLAFALPGVAVLSGSALGSFFYWLYQHLK